MSGKAVAIDMGSHGTKVLVAQAGKHGVRVLRFCGAPTTEAPAALQAANLPPKGAICGLAGRDMTLRYSQVPPTPDWQLRNLMDLEIQDLAQQSGGALSADYNLLPTQDAEAGVDTVLLALAKDEALQRLQDEVAAAGGSVAGFVPNCIALFNAYLKCGPVEEDVVVCLLNVGHETIDIALVKGQDLLFARNLSGGGKVLDDAIAAAFNVSERKAETLKRDLLDLDPQSRGRYASGQAEKVTMAAGGAAQAIVAAVQSSIAFCKTQTKVADLRLDKVLVCGGSARLRGLRGLLREALRCPVELFDPFANLDLTALPAGDAEQLEAMRHEAVVALGLAVGAIDDSLYSLEILPEAVKKRRRFAQRTVWNIAAAAIGVVLLVLQVQHQQQAVEVAEQRLGSLKQQIAIARSVHGQAEAQLATNKVDRALVDHLGALALPLHGLVRTQRAIQAHLPPQLWITRLEVQSKSVGNQKRPVVVIDGAGKELNGVEVGRVFLDFYAAFKADPLMAGAKVELTTPTGTSVIKFTITVDFAGES